MPLGYIYVLTNESFSPDVVKIGFTCGEPHERASELASVTGVPQGFTVEYFELSRDVEEVEQLVHQALDGFRINVGREFFKLEVSAAIQAVKTHVRTPVLRFRRPTSGQSCRRCGALKESDNLYCEACGF